MKKYVVTGASGLIGSHLLKELNKEAKIFAVGRSDVIEHMSSSNVQYIKLDLARDARFDLLPQRVDGVIHLAQSEHFRDFPEHSVEVFEVNTVGTLRLLDYARKLEQGLSFMLLRVGCMVTVMTVLLKIQKLNNVGI